MADTGEQYEASASALGYLFQFAKALHICIEQWMSADLDWNVAVEAADDIEIQRGPDRRLIQLKQRAEGVRMTDLSEDLWKTLRIWAEAAKASRIALAETKLFLLTTAELPEDSAAFCLQPQVVSIATKTALCTCSARPVTHRRRRKGLFRSVLRPSMI